jgi:hypothetical protein
MLTEFGGIAFESKRSPASRRSGATPRPRRPRVRALYEELLDTIIHTALFSGFCYTQFADTFQEANGLLNADRTPKIPLETPSSPAWKR